MDYGLLSLFGLKVAHWFMPCIVTCSSKKESTMIERTFNPQLNRRALDSAYQLLDKALMYYRGRPVGTVAALPPGVPSAANYEECFVRDFVVTGFVHLADGKHELVGNFLEVALQLLDQEVVMEGHEIEPGVIPASFRVVRTADSEYLLADFGDRAIGRVAPVDAMMWWMILVYAYQYKVGDRTWDHEGPSMRHMEHILRLCLKGSFEVLPTLLVPDGSFMIDRRMGVYGHPLEIQTLFYAVLRIADKLFASDDRIRPLLQQAAQRRQRLRHYVRSQYWLDSHRLHQIHRFVTEVFGRRNGNPLNIFPESIPRWVKSWLPERGGYFAGNLGPSRLDTRFFACGNLLAIIFGLAGKKQAQCIMDLYETRWDDLVGAMPIKLCYPALEGEEWRLLTGSDPKNRPWSYHNGGNWPVGLWMFVAAALITRRRKLAERAMAIAAATLPVHDWPEYYDGRCGDTIGRRANLNQTWSAASFIFAYRLLESPELLAMFPGQDVQN